MRENLITFFYQKFFFWPAHGIEGRKLGKLADKKEKGELTGTFPKASAGG
jgi:hypothetical protein